MCGIVDNTSTHQKIARLIKLHHIGCLNHLLDLDIKQWIIEDATSNDLVTNIAALIKEAKTLNNNNNNNNCRLYYLECRAYYSHIHMYYF